jgi:hypothetical protein
LGWQAGSSSSSPLGAGGAAPVGRLNEAMALTLARLTPINWAIFRWGSLSSCSSRSMAATVVVLIICASPCENGRGFRSARTKWVPFYDVVVGADFDPLERNEYRSTNLLWARISIRSNGTSSVLRRWQDSAAQKKEPAAGANSSDGLFLLPDTQALRIPSAQAKSYHKSWPNFKSKNFESVATLPGIYAAACLRARCSD